MPDRSDLAKLNYPDTEWGMPAVIDAFREAFDKGLASAAGHSCPPGEVETKFDGGRIALLCPHCHTIVGYGRARYLGANS